MDDRLRELQLAELEILDAFVRVCEAHGLRYSLTGGTLLGAVRHQGFIPWDDDIDVAMPQDDYRQLIGLKQELLPTVQLNSEETDLDCPYNYCKLYHRFAVFDPLPEKGPREIYIDVYPILPSRAPSGPAKLGMNMISVIGYALQVKCGWEAYKRYKKRSAAFAYALLSRMPIKLLRKLRRSLTRWLTAEGTGYSFSPGGKYGEKEIFPAAWFDHTTKAAFEGREYAVPAEWDAFLRQHYGEYELPPSENDRVHNHKGCRRVEYPA